MQIVLFLRSETSANPLSQTRQSPSLQSEQFLGQGGAVVGPERGKHKSKQVKQLLFNPFFAYVY